MRSWSAFVVVSMFVARTASADDDVARAAAVKAMLEAQGKAMVADDSPAFKATLTADALVSLDGHAPSTDVSLGGVDKTYSVTVASSKIGWAGTWGWVAAEVRIKSVLIAAMVEAHAKPETKTFHLIELIVPDGKQIKAKVVALTPTMPDKDLTAYNYVQELVPLASPSPLVAALAHPTQLSSDPGTSVFGTGEGERGLGGPAAKKLVAGWAKVGLELVDTKDEHDKSSYRAFEQKVGDVTVVWAALRMKLPGQPRWFPISGFAIGRKVGDAWELLALMYASH